jgi:glycosyltransferase involved in cell wall biosynthesis
MIVSIITPSYNAAPYIKQTILSVQRQTLTDWEMIIVDDGSTDNTRDIVRELSVYDSRVKLIEKENGGSASARNLGLSVAQGKYIQFLDADDTIDKYKLEKQCKIMEELHLDVTYTDYSISYPNSEQTIIKRYQFNLIKLLFGWGVFGTIPLHSFIYNKTFLENNFIRNTSEVREREDWDFHIKVFSAHPRILYLKGYCGADYFQCPTGKASNGSLTKLKKGTLKYLFYKIPNMRGYKKWLLILRLSIELLEISLHGIRKKIDLAVIKSTLRTPKKNLWITSISCLFLPLAMLIYAYRTLWIKLKLYFNK